MSRDFEYRAPNCARHCCLSIWQRCRLPYPTMSPPRLFWLLEFRRTEIDPAGSYLAITILRVAGAVASIWASAAFLIYSLSALCRANRDREGGITINTATSMSRRMVWAERSSAFIYHYHSRLPVISARSPPRQSILILTSPLTQVFLRAGLARMPAAAQAAGLFSLITLSQTNPGALTPRATGFAPVATIAGRHQRRPNKSRFSRQPPRPDILSNSREHQNARRKFQRQPRRTGIAGRRGSYKHNVPPSARRRRTAFRHGCALSPTFGAPNNQIGSFWVSTAKNISGYRAKDVWSAQNHHDQVFGPLLGASQLTLVGKSAESMCLICPAKTNCALTEPAPTPAGSQAAMNTPRRRAASLFPPCRGAPLRTRFLGLPDSRPARI